MTSARTERAGYIGDTRWHYRHFKNREYIIGWFYKGQLEKRNIVTIPENATENNCFYFTDNGKSIPKLVFLALLKDLQEKGNQ